MLTGKDVRMLHKIDTGRVDGVHVGTLMRIAVVLGVACSDVLPLLGVQPARASCLAALWVARRGQARAEAQALLLATPSSYVHERGALDARGPVEQHAIAQVKRAQAAARAQELAAAAPDPEALPG